MVSLPMAGNTTAQDIANEGLFDVVGVTASFVAKAAPPSGSDDTAVITSLLSAATTVILTAGAAYKISPGLQIPSGKHLVGQRGAVIALTGTGSNGIVINASASLEGITLDGTAATVTYAATYAGNSASLIGCTIKNFTSAYGLHVPGVSNTETVDNTFSQVDYYAVLVEGSCSHTVIRGNVITHTTATLGQGVTVKTNSGSPVDTLIANNVVDALGTIGLECQVTGTSRAVITGNIVRNVSIGVSLSGASDVTVSSNTISNCPTYGIEAAQATTDSTISGNTVIGGGTGIVVSSPSASPQSSNITISGNTIKGSSTYGINTEYGIGHSIIGNSVTDPASTAIFLNNGTVNTLVSSNHIRRTVAPTGSGDAIYISGQHTSVVGNTVDYISLPIPGTGYGIYNNSPNYTHILGNVVLGTAKAIALVNGNNHAVIGNRTFGSTEHSVYTTGTSTVVVLAHITTQASGVGIDLSGATNSYVGEYWDAAASRVVTVSQELRISGQTTGTVAPAAGAAGALPVTPAGYTTVNINGTDRQIAYY